MRLNRGFISISFLASFVLFGAVVAIMVIHFAMPPKDEYLAGPVERFPPSESPYLVQAGSKRSKLSP